MPSKWDKDQARIKKSLARKERLATARAARKLAQEREIARDREERFRRQLNK